MAKKAKSIEAAPSVAKSRGKRKLTDEQVIDIVTRYQAGAKQAHLAKEHGVTSPTISSIVHGRTYVWLTGISADVKMKRAA